MCTVMAKSRQNQQNRKKAKPRRLVSAIGSVTPKGTRRTVGERGGGGGGDSGEGGGVVLSVILPPSQKVKGRKGKVGR